MPTLCDCPQSDRGQWSFRLFGVPVHVKFWFWVTTVFACYGRELGEILIWVGVCFVSILLHELGHVFAFRLFRRDAEVVLYGFGGLAVPKGNVYGMWPEIIVSAAGPFAGFCLAALTACVVAATGGRLFFGRHLFLLDIGAMISRKALLWSHSRALWLHLTVLADDLLFVNFYWGLINLLPVWPLDGGHISRAVLEEWDREDGRRKSLIASAVIGGVVAIAGLVNQSTWIMVLFGILAVSSVQLLGNERRRPIPYRRWRD